jgi:hypothetical protein
VAATAHELPSWISIIRRSLIRNPSVTQRSPLYLRCWVSFPYPFGAVRAPTTKNVVVKTIARANAKPAR